MQWWHCVRKFVYFQFKSRLQASAGPVRAAPGGFTAGTPHNANIAAAYRARTVRTLTVSIDCID